ncbi:MAG: FAD-dependent 5-carboxymethylaminomethyl-2-thiouridine(34) oxidoreductase MnmC, partial [Burkholderiales bacterium]|nr:FAD-dependent 5-carboxymethylaminomethyl-2-thiouridine(34) oxidoreductase MnmC [Burkholderiales bacterium]
VVERHADAALESSGNPAGLFHGTVIADDGPHARLHRAAALQAQRDYGAAMAGGGVAGSVDGLLRLDRRGLAAMVALLQRQGLPEAYVRALDREQASRLAGVALPDAAWHYPGGGWIAPATWVRRALAAPGIRWCGGRSVEALARDGSRWVLRDAAGAVIASAPLLVLAQGAAAARLLAPWGAAAWPLEHSRGQVSYGPGPGPGGGADTDTGVSTGTGTGTSALRLPVAGDGYAIPLRAGGLLCGATREPGEPGSAIEPTSAARRHNLDRLRTLTGIGLADDAPGWQDRVGWRLHSADRLPIAGALPAPQAGDRLDQARLLRREAGLFVLTALGARGLTLAPLLGRLVAAQATGTPWPLEQDLADVVDPARWLVRRARRG